MRIKLGYIFVVVLTLLMGCKKDVDKYDWIPIKVRVSAYNSHPSQTDGHPYLAAWGDTLKPGMKIIAVSRDLILKGLRHNTLIKIDGLEGVYVVKDKMHSKWRNKIDIYMGDDINKAKEWGRQKRTIRYAVLKDSLDLEKSSNF